MLEQYKISQLLNACAQYAPSYHPNLDIYSCINKVVLDSRVAIAGDVFIALSAGESHNPQSFILKLLKDGVVCITSKTYDSSLLSEIELEKLILVDDAILALGAIAADYKAHIINLQQQLNTQSHQDSSQQSMQVLQTIAVTGSNGKTTLKNMLNSIFTTAYGFSHVCCTEGNLNNHLGLPLTLLSLRLNHKVLIAELGMNHLGEIDYLSGLVHPDIAVVNNYHHAHIGHFSSIDDIIIAKNEIFNHVTKLAIVNNHDNYYLKAKSQIDSYNKQLQSQGESAVEFVALDTIHAKNDMHKLGINLLIIGSHNYANAMTALTIAQKFGVDMQDIKKGLESYKGYQSRLQCLTATNGALLIDDSYNANLESTTAALQALHDLPLHDKLHKWFVFGDIKELGDYSVKHHSTIGDLLNQMGGVDTLLTVGDYTKYTHDKFQGKKIHFTNNQQLLAWIQSNLAIDVIVLFKASKSIKLPEEVVKYLIN